MNLLANRPTGHRAAARTFTEKRDANREAAILSIRAAACSLLLAVGTHLGTHPDGLAG